MRALIRCLGYSLGCLILALPAPSLLGGEQVRFRRGDVNSDGTVDVSDPITELNVLFLGSGEIGCMDAADANDDGKLDISDPIGILSFLFLGGKALPGPSECGVDPTADDLGCANYPPCVIPSFSTLIVVDAPARGAMLTGDPQVAVSGHVGNPASIASLSLNGMPVSLLPDGSFHASVNALHGLNVLRFAATDAGGTTTGERSFFWSEQYQPGGDPKTARISQGVALQLTQDAIDNGSQSKGTIGDLASLVHQLIGSFNLNGAIPDPLFTKGDPSCACKVFPPRVCAPWAQGHARNLQYSSVSTKATLIDGGLAVSISVEGLTMDLSVDGVLACVPFNITGSASASSLTLAGNVAISEASGVPKVTLGSVDATLNGLSFNIDLGLLGGLASDIVNLFSGSLANLLENQIQQMVASQVPPELQAALQELTEVSTQIEGTIAAEYHLESIDVTSQRCRIGLQTAFTPVSAVAPAPGSILQPDPGSPVFPGTSPIAFALSYDALNQFLYSTWATAAYPLDLTAKVPSSKLFQVSSLVVTPHLPPIILPVADGSLRMEIGDLEFHAVLRLGGGGALDVRGFASGSIAGEIAGKDDRVDLQLGALLDQAVEVTETSGNSAVDAQAAADLIDLVLPFVVGQVAGGTVAEFPLPSIDVHALDPSVPSGASLRARDITVTNGPAHIYCGGRFSQ